MPLIKSSIYLSSVFNPFASAYHPSAAILLRSNPSVVCLTSVLGFQLLVIIEEHLRMAISALDVVTDQNIEVVREVRKDSPCNASLVLM